MKKFTWIFSLLFVSFFLSATVSFARIHIKTDSLVSGHISNRRVLPMLYYSNPDHIFVGLRFRIAQGPIKGDPYGMQQFVQLRYSISQNSFSMLYNAKFQRLVGNWNLGINGYYDWLIWTNFFGLGNETQKTNSLTYYRLSTSEFAGNIGLNRVIGNYNYIDIGVHASGVEVFNKPGTLISDDFLNNRSYYFEHHVYSGLHAEYTFQKVDDPLVPTRGIMLFGGAAYTVNVSETEKSYARFNAIAQGYIPLSDKFSISIRAGAAAIAGTPEFYQYVSIGGPMTIRGYYRDRFWGQEGVYNNNELRYITNVSVGKVYGKAGVLALFDDGRVWMPGEVSNTLHTGYGGGIILAPFNKFTGMVTYARSADGGLVQIRVSKLLTQLHPTRRSL